MNAKTFIAGALTGAAAGHLFYHYFIDQKTTSGDAILEKVKTAFKKEGPIEGSWIQLKKQHYKNSRSILSFTTVASLVSVKARKNNLNLSLMRIPVRSLIFI
ncbi:Predicted small secreted protein [Listeria grayi]|uniref:Predicted small secreted protein n=1 Tax=Listeria grayi TaxID=1641 RepID=A0A378MAU3_LISGR|nr:Predicted small secreted protein [Listeria grayi]